MDVDPVLVNLLVSYVANVGADATSWVASKFPRKKGSGSNLSLSGLNTSIQAQLTATGLENAEAEKVSEYLLHTPILGYLFMLVEAGNTDDYQGMPAEDIGALMHLEAGLSYEAARRAAEALVPVIAAAAQHPKFSRTTLDKSRNPRLTGIQIFGAQEAKRRLLDTMGSPSPSDILRYSRLFRERMRQKYGRIQLQHLDNGTEQDLADLYVEPDLWVESRLPGVAQMRPPDLLRSYGRAVIQGPAGSGKSTTVRRLASEVASWPEAGTVPLVIELRTYASGHPLVPSTFLEHLRQTITNQMQEAPPEAFLEYLLVTGRAVVFFDGLDEVLNAGSRAEVRDAVIAFAQLFPTSSVVVTSRHTGYDLAPFAESEWTHADVCELSEKQVEDYAMSWFALKENAVDPSARAASFVEESQAYASDLRVNPLMLSLLCSVYYARGDIPRTLHALYERCADMIYQQWNTMRGIEDHRAWDKDVRPLLYQVAHTLITNDDYISNGIPEDDLVAEMRRAFIANGASDPSEASIRAREAIKLWAGRAWIITPVMTDQAGRLRYGFVHQSFLEYFAAVYEVRKAETPADLYDSLRARLIDLNGWTVTQIAVSVLNAWRDKGGQRFISCLLPDAQTACDLDAFALLRLGISLNTVVPVSTEQLREIIEAGIRFVGRSILLPDGEKTVYSAHRRSETLTSRVPTPRNPGTVEPSVRAPDRETVRLSTARSQLVSDDIADISDESDSSMTTVTSAICSCLADSDEPVVASALLQIALLKERGKWTEESHTKARETLSARTNANWVIVWLAAQLDLIALPGAIERVPWHALLLRQELLLADEIDVLGPQPLGHFLADCLDDESGYHLLEHIGEVIAKNRRPAGGADLVKKDEVQEYFVFYEPAADWREVRDPSTWSAQFYVAFALVSKLAAVGWRNPHAIGEPFNEDTPQLAVQISAAAVGWGKIEEGVLIDTPEPYRSAISMIMTSNWPFETAE